MRSLITSCAAISLFCKPRAINCKTSCSRGDNVSTDFDSSRWLIWRSNLDMTIGCNSDPWNGSRIYNNDFTVVGFDPWTDTELARHFRNAKAVNSREFAGDCLAFIGAAESGRLVWDDAEAISSDLP